MTAEEEWEALEVIAGDLCSQYILFVPLLIVLKSLLLHYSSYTGKSPDESLYWSRHASSSIVVSSPSMLLKR